MNKFVPLSASVFSLLGLPLTASADVTIEQTLDITAPGALSLAAMQGKTVTSIAGDRSRTDNDLKFKSALVQRFGGDAGQTSEIVRLDESRLYQLDHEERQYEVVSFEAMKAQMDEAMQQIEEAGTGSGSPPADGAEPAASTDLPVSEQQCEWSETVVDVTRSGERAVIAGVEAEQTAVAATRTCRDVETGKACDITWRLESWLAEDVPGSDEVVQYWQRYASALGLTDTLNKPGTPGMAALFSQYEGGWEEIEKHADDFEGYPMRLVMSLDIGGAECTTDTGEPISNESAFGDDFQQAMGESAAAGVGESVGGSVGGAIAKGLFGAFGKKKKAEQPAPDAAAGATARSGSVTLFTVVSETTSIRTSAVSVTQFEIPAGYVDVTRPPQKTAAQ